MEGENQKKVTEEDFDALAKRHGMSNESMVGISQTLILVLNDKKSRTTLELCTDFIGVLLEQDATVEQYLEAWQLKDSEHLGRIVRDLSENFGGPKKEEGDEWSDFDGLFTADKIQDFIKETGLKDVKRRIKMWAYPFFVVGTGLWLYWFIFETKDWVLILGLLIGIVAYNLYYLPHKVRKRLKI